MAFGDFKDLARRTASDKVFLTKEYAIASSLQCDKCQRELASIAYKLFDTKAVQAATGTAS